MNKTKPQFEFDFEETLEALKARRDLSGKDGISTLKTVKSVSGSFQLDTHRVRN